MELTPTLQDYQVMLDANPLAMEQLKSIVLIRLLAEAEQKVATFEARDIEAAKITDISKAQAD